jgi:hypothetical protein
MVSSALPPSPLGAEDDGTALTGGAGIAGALSLRWKPRDFISGFFGAAGVVACLVSCSPATQGGDAMDRKIAGTAMKAIALST